MDAVEAFNTRPAEQLAGDLLACLAAAEWGARILAGRPYGQRVLRLERLLDALG